jgi:formiminotetrahydrofolate cyclodeaminase
LRSNIYLERFLDQTAKRGTWYGGGSAAALACALAAALLEKLANRSPATTTIRAIRHRCASLIDQDARAFARVIQAQARHDRRAAHRALKAAIEIPGEVYTSSQRLLSAALHIRKAISPSYQVDLRCAEAFARASREAARVLVLTNLKWLGNHAYSRRIHRKRSRLK